MSAQSYPLTINLSGYSEIMGSVETLTDNTLVMIQNSSSTDQNVYLVVEISGLSSMGPITMHNRDIASLNEILVPPGLLSLTLTRLMDEYQNSSFEDYYINQPRLIESIRRTRQLPEGTYTICMEARDISTNELVSMPGENNCHRFSVTYRNPPEIQGPLNGSVVPENEMNNLHIFWSFDVVNPTLDADVEFDLRVVRIDNQEEAERFMMEGYPIDKFNAYSPIIDERNLTERSYFSVEQGRTLDIEPGDILAAQVIAHSETSSFSNSGMSRIIIFTYGNASSSGGSSIDCLNPHITASVIFPSAGDTIPYTDLFYVGKFDPSCANFKSVDANLNYYGLTMGSHDTYNNNWNTIGPRVFLENYFTRKFGSTQLDFFLPTDSDYETYMPFLHTGSPHFSANRGENVKAVIESTFEYTDNRGRNQTQNVNFTSGSVPSVIGMTRPILLSPEDNAVLDSGNIEFTFKTGNKPENPLPPFKIFHIEGNSDPVVPGLYVREKCVLQVSKKNTFEPENIIFCKMEKVQSDPYNNAASFDISNPNMDATTGVYDNTPRREFDLDNFYDKVYKDVNFTANLLVEDTLYWRVVWLKDPYRFNTFTPCGSGVAITEADIYHPSAIRKLILSHSLVATVDSTATPEGEDSTGCSSTCIFPAITNTTEGDPVQVGDEVTVAGFTMTIKEATGSSSRNGKAVITLPFFNNIKLKVNFTNLKVNAAQQMISGNVDPEVDNSTPFHVREIADGIFDMEETEADALEASLATTHKLISMLTPGSEVALPLGIDKEIDGNTITVGITSMTFEKDTASLTMLANLKIPAIGEMLTDAVGGFFSLGANVCMTNNGLHNDIKIFLPQDRVFDLGNSNQFIVNGAEGRTNPLDITSLELDCSGFKSLTLAATAKFTRDWMLPEDEDGNIKEEGQVEGKMSVKVTKGDGFIARMHLQPFQIPDLDGWRFVPGDSVWIDFSDIENPSNITSSLPEGYNHSAFNTAGMENTWKGFFMGELSVKTPKFIEGSSSERSISISLNNMFIDNTGLSFQLYATNLLRWEEEGSLSGWKASLDTIAFHMIQNNFRIVKFDGKLGIPIADSTQFLKYCAALEHKDGEFKFVVNVRPEGDIKIPISMAEATIGAATYVELNVGAETFIEMNLCASLTIKNDFLPSGMSMPSSLSLPGIWVENLRISSNRGIDTTHNFNYGLTGLEGMGRPSGGGTGYLFDDDPSGNFGYMTYLGGDNVRGPSPDGDSPSGGGGGSSSTMSGFPITLESFSISNEEIVIEPKIILAADNEGFAASAKIALLINPDIENGFKNFTVNGVRLDEINLQVTVSALELDGSLRFYKTETKEGVEGSLAIKIKVGIEVEAQIAAEFGTYKRDRFVTEFNSPDWYTYFYVDGIVAFSSGITLFSGVSLYGLGGGFYYHMTQSALTEANNVTATSSARAATYTNNYNTKFGLQITVLIGSNDEGKAYNIAATLGAEFSESGGLSHLFIKGKFKVMSDGISISSLAKPAGVDGYVSLDLWEPAGDNPIFHGVLFVKLAIPPDAPMLKGAGTVPPGFEIPRNYTAENFMVLAVFHAERNNYYFKMGEPSAKAGVSLTIAGQRLFEVYNYLMIGDGLPTILPNPDQEFLDIFHEGAGDRADFRSPEGDPNSLLAGKEPPRGMGLGSGFAAGLTMKLNTGDVEFFPFFFNLKAVMGVDINITHDDSGDRRCSGWSTSAPPPGIDGWYATGQFYAGIKGVFGIKINLFVTEIKAEILRASAALILSGGLPNPEWMSGKGNFYYNVCNGLAEGRCSFSLSVGDVCIATTGNPFAGIQMIQDISPADQARDVSIYSKLSASFSMDMKRTYEIEEYASAVDPPIIRRLSPYMSNFKITRLNSSAPLALQESQWTDNNHVYTAMPTDRLDPNTQFKITVEAKVRENGEDLRDRGQVYKEIKEVTFTTGPEPDHLVDENIYFTYPYINQRYFLKGETDGNKGYIVCKQGNNGCLTGPLFATFTEEGSNYVISVPLSIIGNKKGVQFDISLLKNSKIYRLDITNTDLSTFKLVGMAPQNYVVQTAPPSEPSHQPKAKENVYIVEAGIENGTLSDGLTIKSQTELYDIKNLSKTIGESTILSNQFKEFKLSDAAKAIKIKILYSYHFRTSKYNTFKEKIHANPSEWNIEELGADMKIYKIGKDLEESTEWIDNTSFKVLPLSNARTFNPRVQFVLQPPSGYYNEFATISLPSTAVLPRNRYLQLLDQIIIAPNSLAKAYRNNATNKVMNSLLRNLSMDGKTHSIGTISRYVSIPSVGISYVDFGDFEKFISLSNGNNALSQDEINYAFKAAEETRSQNIIIPITSISTPISIGTNLSISNPNMKITYSLSVKGYSLYRQLQSSIQRFNNSSYVFRERDYYNNVFGENILTLSNNVGSSMYNFLFYPTERAFYNSHALRSSVIDQMRYVQYRPERQDFGIRYLFPNTSGEDMEGSFQATYFEIPGN